MPAKVCPRCETGEGKHRVLIPTPSFATFEKWMDNGVAKASDGCKVEPDGKCPHGHNSMLVLMGYI